MPRITYLHRDKNSGCYYFRKVLPTEFQPLYGKVIKISLRTKDRMVAEDKFWEHALEWAGKRKKSSKSTKLREPHIQDALDVLRHVFNIGCEASMITSDFLEGTRKRKYSPHIHPDAISVVDAIIDELKKPFDGQEYSSEKVQQLSHQVIWMGKCVPTMMLIAQGSGFPCWHCGRALV